MELVEKNLRRSCHSRRHGVLRPRAPASAAEQGAVRVAAAADLRFAMDDIVEAFRRERPAIGVQVTYGSSGNFYAQLSNRAPFDIFFSADVDYPRRLIRQARRSPTASSCMA